MDAVRKKIIVVDDNVSNLTQARNILKPFYEVFPAPSADKMFELLEKIMPDLILLDIEMPKKNGYEAIRALKAIPEYNEIPVIFLTIKTDSESELSGLDLGAVDFVTKPFNAPILLKRMERELLIASQTKQLKKHQKEMTQLIAALEQSVQEKVEDITNLQNSVIDNVAEMVEFRDNLSGGHIMRTKIFLRILLEEMVAQGVYAEIIKDWDINLVISSAVLHDVGKIAIPDVILLKKGTLTPEEFEVMKGHVSASVDLVERMTENTVNNDFLRHAFVIAGTHHERWDGSGYPIGLRGENIPLEGRLMAIVDVYDALVSERPYKKPYTHEEGYKIICEDAGKQFDPKLVDVFKRVAEEMYQQKVEYDKEHTKKNAAIGL
ncbi:MAG: response regulator [Lachnospiraceae bacterium]|nr:response regulator [Lachnospiraceae bacterium]